MKIDTCDIYGHLEPIIHPHERDDVLEILTSGNQYEWLAGIARDVVPQVILETGVRYGYGAASMICGTYIGHGHNGKPPVYWGVDKDEASLRYAWRAIIEATEVAPRFQVADLALISFIEAPKADLIHVDGYHHGIRRELSLITPHRHDNTVLVIDDVGGVGYQHNRDTRAIRQASIEYAQAHGLEMEILPSWNGTAVLAPKGLL